MKIDFATFREIAPFVFEARHPLMIRGRHGIGKSEVVYQAAADLGLRVVERRASQMTEGDLVGLPTIEDAATAWNPPDWFKDACCSPVMLFLDEVDRAVIEVRQGIFELTDSRKLNGFALHKDTLVVAAVNGGDEGAQYQVGEMDPAELDRWTVYDISPSVEDWMQWGKAPARDADGRELGHNNLDKVVLDFVNQNIPHLENAKDDFVANKKYPSRRSWKRLNDTMRESGLLEEWSDKIRLLSLGYVGFEAACAFSDFFGSYDRQVSPADIIDKGKLELTKDYGLIEHLTLIEKMATMESLAKKLTKKQIKNLGEYFITLPSEAAMKIWGGLNVGPTENTVALHAQPVTINGKKTAVSIYLRELLTGMQAKKEAEEAAAKS